MELVISDKIKAKLQAKHDVSPKDVMECFWNRIGEVFEDVREEHRTDPPTLFFISENNHGRVLKVCYVERAGRIHLKTCFEPSASQLEAYRQLCGDAAP